MEESRKRKIPAARLKEEDPLGAIITICSYLPGIFLKRKKKTKQKRKFFSERDGDESRRRKANRRGERA